MFAETLNRYADRIIIRDPNFQIPPHWKRIAGFDHGKTNPTAALVVAIDCDGTIYCLAEYYQPGLTPNQHIDNLRRLPGFLTLSGQIHRSFIKARRSRTVDSNPLPTCIGRPDCPV